MRRAFLNIHILILIIGSEKPIIKTVVAASSF